MQTHSTSWGTNEHILARLVCHGVDEALHTIQSLVALESASTEAIHFGNLDEFATSPKRANLASRYNVFFIFLSNVNHICSNNANILGVNHIQVLSSHETNNEISLTSCSLLSCPVGNAYFFPFESRILPAVGWDVYT